MSPYNLVLLPPVALLLQRDASLHPAATVGLSLSFFLSRYVSLSPSLSPPPSRIVFLHPTLYTLTPPPSTLHPPPSTLHPNPFTPAQKLVWGVVVRPSTPL